MAELILSPIAEKIIGGLGSEAGKHISLIWGVEDELEDLKETISTIQAVLLDAEKKQSHNNQIKNWLQRLSTVVFKADDLMDDFNTQALIMSHNPMANQVWIVFYFQKYFFSNILYFIFLLTYIDLRSGLGFQNQTRTQALTWTRTLGPKLGHGLRTWTRTPDTKLEPQM
uniref:Disease resistance N-terminal domain-containing protein n=1 Tax=Cannabis sativa TaxID=3483 RepID=A0A803R168_CANSA